MLPKAPSNFDLASKGAIWMLFWMLFCNGERGSVSPSLFAILFNIPNSIIGARGVQYTLVIGYYDYHLMTLLFACFISFQREKRELEII